MGVFDSHRPARAKALFYNFLSALTALAGALIAYLFADFVQKNLYIFLSLTAGFFIYISASDLIPQIHEKYLENRKFNQIFIFLVGITSVLIFKIIFGG